MSFVFCNTDLRYTQDVNEEIGGRGKEGEETEGEGEWARHPKGASLIPQGNCITY